MNLKNINFTNCIVKKQINNVARKFALKLIIVFGSQVTRKTHEKSDFDLALLAKKSNFTLKQYSNLVFHLQKVFPEQELDIVFVSHADPLLLKKIVETGFLLYGKKRDFAEFKIYAFHRYQDYQPYFELEKKVVENYIRKLNYAH